jgi:hypothetical protein
VKLLLDECVPRQLRRDFLAHGHEVHTVPDMGWSSWKNGQLLAAAAQAGFSALLTMDKSIPNQQNLTRYPIPILGFRARSNDINDLRPLVSEALRILLDAKPGEFRRVEVPMK